jgi:hypothetical protein
VNGPQCRICMCVCSDTQIGKNWQDLRFSQLCWLRLHFPNVLPLFCIFSFSWILYYVGFIMLVKTCYKTELIKTFAWPRLPLLAYTFHLWLVCSQYVYSLWCCWCMHKICYITDLKRFLFGFILFSTLVTALFLIFRWYACTELAIILNSKMFAWLVLCVHFALLTALYLFCR